MLYFMYINLIMHWRPNQQNKTVGLNISDTFNVHKYDVVFLYLSGTMSSLLTAGMESLLSTRISDSALGGSSARLDAFMVV
jgi:hypothetical protein